MRACVECRAVSSARLLRNASPQQRPHASLGLSVQRTLMHPLSFFPALSFEQRPGPTSLHRAAAGRACENFY